MKRPPVLVVEPPTEYPLAEARGCLAAVVVASFLWVVIFIAGTAAWTAVHSLVQR